ncbi:DTDP-glucose 4,6-dehydratase [Lachnospiraceae bacterium KM106-2]|nr:DTDP-glucose 4,6-dehydratase [Lachnospiraceae bacterium KM106-2]
MKLLVTGGTVFVSRFVAKYFMDLGHEVSVLNRNHHKQIKGVTVIEADRHSLQGCLCDRSFDAVLDITAYTREDISCLLEELPQVKDYIMISSSAIYPESLEQPLRECDLGGANRIWGEYGIHKYEAEQYLLERCPNAYILRPPYLYGPMENLYREPFVFDCAREGRPFYVPGDGTMPLQFFAVEDLCRFIDILLRIHPKQHIFNVGNEETITVNEWVRLCYEVAGKKVIIKQIHNDWNQREYFCFHNYDYRLDVSAQKALMPHTKPLKQGLKEAYDWYLQHEIEVKKRPYLEFLNKNGFK